jgi:hypothetical protein
MALSVGQPYVVAWASVEVMEAMAGSECRSVDRGERMLCVCGMKPSQRRVGYRTQQGEEGLSRVSRLSE